MTAFRFLFACMFSALLWVVLVWIAYGVIG